MEFSRQEYWSGLPFPSPGDLPNPGMEPGSPTLQADGLPSEPPGKPVDMSKFLKQKVKEESFIPFFFLRQDSNHRLWGPFSFCRHKRSCSTKPRQDQIPHCRCSLSSILIHITKGTRDVAAWPSPLITHTVFISDFPAPPSFTDQQEHGFLCLSSLL